MKTRLSTDGVTFRVDQKEFDLGVGEADILAAIKALDPPLSAEEVNCLYRAGLSLTALAYATKTAQKDAALPRICVEHAELLVGEQRITLSVLDSWRGWNIVEAALKHLPSPPTAAEWTVLDSLAKTQAAKNGLAEVKSALARSFPPASTKPT